MRVACARIAVVLVLAVTAIAHAKPAGIVVTLDGAGKGPRRQTFAGAVVVDAGTGEVVAARRTSSAKLVLRPPDGVYHVLAGVTRPSGGLETMSDLLRYGAGTTARMSLQLHAATAARPRVAATGVATLVATVGSLTLNGTAPLPTAPLMSALHAATLDRCTVRWVETGAAFLATRAAEIALQEQGLLDPSTPIAGDLVPARFRVDGALAGAAGRVSGELRLIDVAGDLVVGTATFTAKPRKLVASFTAAIEALVAMLCAQPPASA